MSQGIHPRIRSVVVMLTLTGVLLLPLAALAGTSPAGKWVGEVKTPDGDKVDIHLTLDQQGSAWAGTLQDPTIGETTVTNLRVTDTRISFTFKPANAPFPLNFSGSYVAGDDRVTGTFSLHGNSRFVKFQRLPGSETVALAADAVPHEPARIRHDYKFAATGRLSLWAPMHVVKDEMYTMNDVTAKALTFDATVRWYVLDGFNVFFRYYRAGQNYTDNEVKLEPFSDLNLSADSYLKLDGMEIGIMGYLGNLMARESKFNPYLTASLGQVDWTLYENGRDSQPAELDLIAFAGEDMAVALGVGTEYELGAKTALEFEWLWRYFLTEDEKAWADTDATWSNTHVWSLSVGMTYGF